MGVSDNCTFFSQQGFVFGHLPGLVQCNYRAEVYALFMGLKLLAGSELEGLEITMVTDCKGVWKVWDERSPVHFMDGAADVWRKIRVLQKELLRKRIRVNVRWVPSHLSDADVAEGTISRSDRVGNEWADTAAKKGSRVHALAAGVVKDFSFSLLSLLHGLDIQFGFIVSASRLVTGMMMTGLRHLCLEG